MAEQKKGAYDGLRAENTKTTPVLIDKLPTEVQAALRRQLQYTAGPGQVSYSGEPSERVTIKPLQQQQRRPGVNQPVSSLPVSSAARDMQILKDAGIAGRVVLDSTAASEGADPGASRRAFAVAPDGSVSGTAWRHKDLSGSASRPLGAGEMQTVAWNEGFYDAQGKRAGVIRAAKTPVTVGPKMTAKGMSVLDVGPAMYQLMTNDIDTDFTVKMIPKQFRKPDETGKMREAVVIVNGQPFVQYEGEAFNVPGFEDVGDELGAYFREHASGAMGKDKLGGDVEGTGLEVRESDKQAMDKKLQAGAQEAAGSTGPRKGGAPTFEEEYQVGRPSKEPKLPGAYDVLRNL